MPEENNEIFEKRKGTTDLGKDYEHSYIADLILKLVTDEKVENFYISSNAVGFGAFDDVVVEVKYQDKDEWETYAIQLKQKKNKVVRNKDLQHKKQKVQTPDGSKKPKQDKDFNIAWYFKDYCNNLKKSEKSVKMILYTNCKAQFENTVELCLQEEQVNVSISQAQEDLLSPSERDLLATSENGVCYVLCAEDKHKDFFDNFFLYTNQINAEHIEKRTTKLFRKIFSCDEASFNEYVNFITRWSMKEGTKEKLSKTWMKQTITICILSSVIKPLSFSLNTPNNDKESTFKEAVSKYHITTLQEESYEKIKNLWRDVVDDLDYRQLNKIKTKYQIERFGFFNGRDDFKEAENREASTLLWLLEKCPLIVEEQPQIYEAMNLCPEKCFIVIRSAERSLRYVFENPVHLEETNKNFIFRNLHDLKKEEHIYDKILTTCTYSLEGQSENILNSMIDLDDSLTSGITTDKLVQMMNEPLLVGKVKEVLPPCHVSRMLSKILIDTQFLKKCENAVIVIDRVDNIYNIKDTFNGFHVIDVEHDGNDEGRNDKVIYVSKKNFALGDFQKLCNKLVGKSNYHQFRYLNKQTLEWVRSRSSSSVENLDKFRIDHGYSDNVINELRLFKDGDNDINIICANPGMGKSTLMRSLKLSSSSVWSIFIYSRSHGSYFRKKEEKVDIFLDYIFDDNCEKYNEFDRHIFRALLNKGQIQLIWDGLDEVSEKNLQTILNLVKLLEERGIRQWITSRNHTKDILESSLNTFSRKVQEFSKEEQETYIKTRLQLEDDKISEIFARIKTNLEAFSNNDILGIPLQIYMLTELLSQNLEKYLNLLDHTFTMLDLYEYFVKEKFEIYYRERTNCDLNIDEVYEKCNLEMNQRITSYKKISRDLYLENRFSSMCSYRILCICTSQNKFLDSIKVSGDSVGIISVVTKENIPKFSHDTYGEYFAALYLFDSDPHRAEDDTFINSKKFINIRFFLDLMLSKTSKAHVAVLYKNFLLLQECTDEDFESKDKLNRDVLELACVWSQKHKIVKINKDENQVFRISPKYINASKEKKEKLSHSEVSKHFDQIRNSIDISIKRLLFLLPFLIQLFAKAPKTFNPQVIATLFFYAIKFDYVVIFNVMESTPVVQGVYNAFQPKELLTVATSFRSLKCLQKMLCQQAYIDILQESTDILLQVCRFAFADVFSVLLKNKLVDINQMLYEACEKGNSENVEFLLKNGANMFLLSSKHLKPIHYACKNEENGFDIVKLLLERGEDVNIPAEDNLRPIHFACKQKTSGSKLVDFLINQGTIADAPDDFKFTPIHYACQYGNVETVKLLIEKGVKVDDVLRNKRKLLHYACRNPENGVHTVRYLITAGESVNVSDFKNITPMHWACKKGSYETVKLVIDHGGKIDGVDIKGRTPIHNACKNEKAGLEIVKLLVNKGVKVNVQDVEGRMPLHEACRNWNFGSDIVKVLISKHTKVDAVDVHGRTPLHYACRNFKSGVGCVKMLVERGAKKDCLDLCRKTPLDYAHVTRNVDVLHFFDENVL